MLDKYLCRKFKEKKITVRMLIDYLEENHSRLTLMILTPLTILMAYDLYGMFYTTYTDSGLIAVIVRFVLTLAISVVVLRALHKIEERVVVATCPLGKK